MTFRPRRGNYITQRRGRYYYRRIVPSSFQEVIGKKVILVPLRGGNDADREKEAKAIAVQHDRQFSFSDEPIKVPTDAVEARIDLAPVDAPGEPGRMRVYRDGTFEDVTKIAISDDPAKLRAATRDGYFAMSQREAALQMELEALRKKFETASTEDARELADLKAANVATEIDATSASAASETIISVLSSWRANRKQAPTTWKKHNQYAREFVDLHGDLPLIEITKRHVVEYVEHAQTLTYRGEPLSPGSIAKRLDSIKALLSYSVSADLISSNPAQGVKPPRDTRPKTSQSWKSFERKEIEHLVDTATKLWQDRRARRTPGRQSDLITALHCLIWSGARPEEICQLRRADVDLSRKAITITNEETDDDAPARRLKNARSTREIPIHLRLLPILQDHLLSCGSPLLFPSFQPIATKAELQQAEQSGTVVEIKGRYARPISREWTDHLRHLIAPNDHRKVLYSLRHSWAAESRRSGMPEHVRNAIMGHSDDNPNAARYGSDADWLAVKSEHVQRMECM